MSRAVASTLNRAAASTLNPHRYLGSARPLVFSRAMSHGHGGGSKGYRVNWPIDSKTTPFCTADELVDQISSINRRLDQQNAYLAQLVSVTAAQKAASEAELAAGKLRDEKTARLGIAVMVGSLVVYAAVLYRFSQ
jgi:hypothetical protein